MYEDIDDTALYGLVRMNDRSAFNVLYDRYWDRLLEIAYKNTQNLAASEDILQDVFVSLWTNRQKVAVDKMENYLATAVKFASFNYFRNLRRSKGIDYPVDMSVATVTGEEILSAKYLLNEIETITMQLPQKCQLIFRYRHDYGMTNQEIAEKLDISRQTVKNQLSAALAHFRKSLKLFLGVFSPF